MRRNSSKSIVARLLRAWVTANLALAILVLVGYAVFLFNEVDPLPERFLGFSTYSGEQIPILFSVFRSAAIVTLFLWRRFLLLNQTPTRIVCVFFGLWGLSFTAVLPVLKSQVYGESVLTLDNALGWYVWSSHLLFGVIGSNDRLAIGDRNHVPQP